MGLSGLPHSISQDRDSHFVCLSLFEVIVVAVLLGIGVPISVLHEAMFGDSSAPRLFSISIDAVQGGLFFGVLFIGAHRLARADLKRLKGRSS
jgi:hypothetical protein